MRQTSADSPEEPSLDRSPSASSRVIHRTAATGERDATELPPLYDAIDPDALDALVDSTTEESARLSIEFTYAGHRVAVDVNGAVDVAPERT